ncbi:MAG: polymer-forming cytoskeletal protein [Candidatus Thermoplasmatota archaeon]
MKAWFASHLAPRRTGDGYVVPKGALMPKVRVANPAGHVFAGPGATLEALDAAGRVTLARGVTVRGPLAAGAELILGANCVVQGPITAQGRVVVQSSRTGNIDAGGDVLLLGDCVVGDVRSGGDIVIVGAPKTGRLEPKGRVASRPW